MGTVARHVLDAMALRATVARIEIFRTDGIAPNALLVAATYLLALWHTTLPDQAIPHVHPSLTQLTQQIAMQYRDAPGMSTVLDFVDDIRYLATNSANTALEAEIVASELLLIEGWVRAVASI